MKNVINNNNYNEILNKIEDKNVYEYINLVEKEDRTNTDNLEFIRGSLDFSFGLNISAMCVEDIIDCLEEKQLRLMIAKVKSDTDMFFYYLVNKEDNIIFDGKALDAKELYVILYTHISSKIVDKEEYSESAYTEAICQLMGLGYTLSFGQDKYTVLTDNENEVFFGVNINEDNLNKIKNTNSENFYSEGFRNFNGVVIENATDTFEIVNVLCEKHKNQVCYIENTQKIYGETEGEFYNNI